MMNSYSRKRPSKQTLEQVDKEIEKDLPQNEGEDC